MRRYGLLYLAAPIGLVLVLLRDFLADLKIGFGSLVREVGRSEHRLTNAKAAIRRNGHESSQEVGWIPNRKDTKET